MKTIFLDVDGVLADFVGGACRLLRVNEPKLHARWPAGMWDFYRLLGLTEGDFNGAIAKAGADFWVGLDALPHAAELVQFCALRADTYFVSTPTPDSGSIAGKWKWLHHFCGDRAKLSAFTSHKELLAGPGKLLVDDNDGNCRRFVHAGGDALVFPAHYNARHAEADNALEITKQGIIAWLNS